MAMHSASFAHVGVWQRSGRAMARARRGDDRLDEEMIDVGLAAHPPARALDEHAEPISLLSPSSCQEKSSGAFRRLTGRDALGCTASLPGGPWRDGAGGQASGFVTTLAISECAHEISWGYAARAPETVRVPWKLG